jgi:hypothetical protein
VLTGGLNNDRGTGFGLRGDLLQGGSGADTITDLEPNDLDNLIGDDGPDTLNAQDGDPNDMVQGRQGSDNCSFDQGDDVTSCP